MNTAPASPADVAGLLRHLAALLDAPAPAADALTVALAGPELPEVPAVPEVPATPARNAPAPAAAVTTARFLVRVRGYSQAAAAEAVGYSQASVSGWLSGRRRRDA